jgi:hypothetical protein
VSGSLMSSATESFESMDGLDFIQKWWQNGHSKVLRCRTHSKDCEHCLKMKGVFLSEMMFSMGDRVSVQHFLP